MELRLVVGRASPVDMMMAAGKDHPCSVVLGTLVLKDEIKGHGAIEV